MGKYKKEDIFRFAEEEDVEFVRLQFTDMFGTMKNMAVTSAQLQKAVDNKCMFDGSLIEGFARIEESDMYLYPDLDTYVTFPWRPQQGKVARFICDIYRPDGSRFEGDPRFILQKVRNEVKELGYELCVNTACEFFLFNTDENGLPTVETNEQAGYFDLSPSDMGENARRDIVMALTDMGMEINCSEHERSNGQHEINIAPCEVLTCADNIQTFRFAVKTLAKRHGLHATFMPKPRYDLAGSGMHLGLILKKDGKNCFYDPDKEEGLSDEARYFIGGMMTHINALTAVTSPIVNSYKRLVPGYETAPVYTAWSYTNRTALMRVPSHMKENTIIEFRSADSAANPYLALAVCLAAGIEGIKKHIEPPKPIEKNIYEMSRKERSEAGIDNLPGSLGEAIDALEGDEFIKNVLGEDISKKFIHAKREEFADYRAHVSRWELDKYLTRI